MEEVNKIKAFIEQNELLQALDQSLSLFGQNEQLKEETMLLKRRFHQLQKQSRLGLMTIADEVKMMDQLGKELFQLVKSFS
jgi:hypothetical protein